MEEKQLAPPAALDPPFTATRRELAAALASFALGRLYLAQYDWVAYGFQGQRYHWGILVFAALYIGLAELLAWGKPRPAESWFWLGCLSLTLIGRVFDRHGVWEELDSLLYVHVFAVWWAVSRSGALLENRSGHLIPLDMARGACLYPFSNWLLRLRTLWHFTGGRPRERKIHWNGALYGLLAVLAAAFLFATAASLLTRADATFAALWAWEGFADWLDDLDFTLPLLSLPVGAYLYGLLAGVSRERPERVAAQAAWINAGLGRLGRVPSGVWAALGGCFCLFYGVFFGVQATYLFGAFTRTLPEGFIVSQYAREGFFELCQVMAVNFALLWLLRRTARGADRPLLAVSGVLLAESALFAVVALSKLWLYIDCFGFTPLRLKALWLILTLLAGVLAWAVSLFAKRETFRPWCCAACLSLALLALV